MKCLKISLITIYLPKKKSNKNVNNVRQLKCNNKYCFLFFKLSNSKLLIDKSNVLLPLLLPIMVTN